MVVVGAGKERDSRGCRLPFLTHFDHDLMLYDSFMFHTSVPLEPDKLWLAYTLPRRSTYYDCAFTKQ
jgi:hypothetical protein